MREIAKILELPVPERMELVEAIWDSIVEIPEALPLTDEVREELDRRLENYYAHPESARPWAEIRRELFPSE